MVNYYANAIKILEFGDYDETEILNIIAQKHPSVVVKAYWESKKTSKLWEDYARKYLLDGKKVAAVKWCIDQTGMSLADAKEAVERIEI